MKVKLIVSFLAALVLSIGFATPSLAHWADLAVAEVMVESTRTQINLTFPTGLVAFADDSRDGQISEDEFSRHKSEIQQFLGNGIRLTNDKGERGQLAITPSNSTKLPLNLKVNTNTHTTWQLAYTWQQPVLSLRMHYDLFLKEAPAAHCLATIFHLGKVQNFIFSRQSRDFWLMSGSWFQGSAIAAIALAMVWGAMHAMTPGHGKTIVGAYLVGSRANPRQAVILGLITTLTHTIGVFALGLIALFASRYFLPEQILPWLSIVAGVMVVVIGLNLFFNRLRIQRHHHHHDHTHDHHHHHHDDHHHSHLPPEDAPITWRSLLALGISGGLVPCPSALVLLLSAIATGRIAFGLVLVLAFSLGLAGVLTGLGLLVVYGQQRFAQFPKPARLMRVLPYATALFISALGVGMTTQALMEIGILRI